MIRSAGEARLILRRTGKPSPRMDKSEAKGYLAALQGPEVKALEIYCQHFKTCKSGLSRNKPCTCGFDDALAQYREAVKQ